MIPNRMSMINPAKPRVDPPPSAAVVAPEDPIGPEVVESKAVLSKGDLPPQPPRQAHGASVATATAASVATATAAKVNGSGPTPTDLLNALRGFTSVTKNTNAMTEPLLKRGLIVANGPHHVISPKGLGYLVDFGILE